MIYVAFLRGINVGSHAVKMSELRSIFESLGLIRVRSYINSGNIFFESETANKIELAQKIEAALQDKLGYAVPTFLRTTDELDTLIALDKFSSIKLGDDNRFCVMFLDTPLPTNMQLPITSSKNDMELIGLTQYEAFVVWHIINGRPPSGKFDKTIVPDRNTTRFYHTLRKINTAAKAV